MDEVDLGELELSLELFELYPVEARCKEVRKACCHLVWLLYRSDYEFRSGETLAANVTNDLDIHQRPVSHHHPFKACLILSLSRDRFDMIQPRRS